MKCIKWHSLFTFPIAAKHFGLRIGGGGGGGGEEEEEEEEELEVELENFNTQG